MDTQNHVARNRSELEKFNYVRKATPKTNYWFSIYHAKLRRFETKFGDDFKIIFFGDNNVEGDFFTIPFQAVKHVFSDEFLSHDQQSSNRWVGNIKHFQLNVTHYPFSIDLSSYYGDELQLGLTTTSTFFKESSGENKYHTEREQSKSDQRQNDYAIENRKIEIEARQKQSRFREDVLVNFEKQCCISGITESNLLVASHIIPWAKRIKTRLDPSNGLCLSVLYDKLFDKGYISFDRSFKVIVTSRLESLSDELLNILHEIEGRKMSQPVKHPIKQEYLAYHRKEIFERH